LVLALLGVCSYQTRFEVTGVLTRLESARKRFRRALEAALTSVDPARLPALRIPSPLPVFLAYIGGLDFV
jgi:hypothetical protein